MIKRFVWTIWTPMSSVLKKADKLNLSLSCGHTQFVLSDYEFKIFLQIRWTIIYTNVTTSHALSYHLTHIDFHLALICTTYPDPPLPALTVPFLLLGYKWQDYTPVGGLRDIRWY